MVVATALLDDNNVYRIWFRTAASHCAYQVKEIRPNLSYKRLGHVNNARMNEKILHCESCLFGKQYWFPHQSRKVRKEEIVERVFLDVR